MGKVGFRQRSSSRVYKQKTARCNSRIKKALAKEKSSTKGLSCEKIISLTNCFPRFIGCFAEKTLESLKIYTKPVYLMVHVGPQHGHWIALGIFDNCIEIFDPLGFEIFKWPSIPCSFLNFLHTISTNKKLVISDKVQSDTSHFCGFYCLLYIVKRPYLSFTKIQSLFRKPSQNDRLLS